MSPAPAVLHLTVYQGQPFEFPPFRMLTDTDPVAYADLSQYTFAAQLRAPDGRGPVEANGAAVMAFDTSGGVVRPTLPQGVTAQMTAPNGTYDLTATYLPSGRRQKLYRGVWLLVPESTKAAP